MEFSSGNRIAMKPTCPCPRVVPQAGYNRMEPRQLMGTDSYRRMLLFFLFSFTLCCVLLLPSLCSGNLIIMWNKAVSTAQLDGTWRRWPAQEAMVALTRPTRFPARSTSAKYATTTSTWTDTLPNHWAVRTPFATSASTSCTPGRGEDGESVARCVAIGLRCRIIGFTTSLKTRHWPQRSRLKRTSPRARPTQTPRSRPERVTTAVTPASKLRSRPATCAPSSLSCPWWCSYSWASSLYITSVTLRRPSAPSVCLLPASSPCCRSFSLG